MLLPDRCERLARRAHELPLGGLISLAVAMFCATSVQGTLEEVVFRGYLQPRVGAWVGRAWIAIAVVGTFFTAVHIDAWTGPGIVYIAGFSVAFVGPGRHGQRLASKVEHHPPRYTAGCGEILGRPRRPAPRG